jgi:small-conductance mechanosensitive channel
MSSLSRRVRHRPGSLLSGHRAEVAGEVLQAVRGDFRRAFVAGFVALVVLVAAGYLPELHSPGGRTRLITAVLALAFAILGVVATRAAASGMARAASHTSPAAGAATRVLVILSGYLLVLLAVLDLLSVPVQHLLVGGAVTGVVVGVAAQQPLSNLFAGLLFLITRPVAVGHSVRVHSGALGGPLEGTITDIGLIYTTLHSDPDTVLIPNAALLNSALRSTGTVADVADQRSTDPLPPPETHTGPDSDTGGEPS